MLSFIIWFLTSDFKNSKLFVIFGHCCSSFIEQLKRRPLRQISCITTTTSYLCCAKEDELQSTTWRRNLCVLISRGGEVLRQFRDLTQLEISWGSPAVRNSSTILAKVVWNSVRKNGEEDEINEWILLIWFSYVLVRNKLKRLKKVSK